MGLVLDAPLPDGLSNVRLVRAVRALLDFLYLAKYPIHTDESLQFLEDSLGRFHTNKQIFIDLAFVRHLIFRNCILHGTTLSTSNCTVL